MAQRAEKEEKVREEQERKREKKERMLQKARVRPLLSLRIPQCLTWT